MTAPTPIARCATAARLTIAALLATALAPADSRAADAASNRPPWARAPLAAHAKTNPYEGNRDAVRAGHKLFARHCTECHGEDGRGGRNAPPLNGETIGRATAGDLFWFLTNGNLRTGMPAWSHLPDARRWQIVAFLKTLNAGAAREQRAAQ
jgi:mono/diheme cytochrome c family protein